MWLTYNKDEATIFACNQEFNHSIRTPKRCTVCRMPFESDIHKLNLYNTEALFCCKDCKHYYLQVLSELKILFEDKIR